MSRNPDQLQLLKFLRSLENFLSKNENWLQKPEEKIKAFEVEMEKWNKEFTGKMGNVEKLIKELEKRME